MSVGTAPTYATLQDLRDYLSSSGNLGTAEDGLLTDCLLAAERAIEDYTRRRFGTTAGTIYYSRFTANVSGAALYTDEDIYAIRGGTVWNGDGQAIPAGSIWLEPRNEGPPYRVLRLYSTYVWTWNTDSEIAIPAAIGFSDRAPEAIRQATREYAAFLYRAKDQGPGDVAGFEEGGIVQQPKGMPESVRRKLEPYRSRSGGVV